MIKAGKAMKVPQRLASEARHFGNLVHAGVDGVNHAREAQDTPPVSFNLVWVSTALGAAAGMWMASRRKSNSEYGVALAGFIGCAVGLGCGFAWASRGVTGALARGAMREIDTVRDARWLERNPIDYA
jgi:hypothetical protein